MQYQGVQVSLTESRPDLSNVHREEDPVRIFNSVSKKVQNLIVEQGFGSTEDWHLINNIAGRMSLSGTDVQLNRNLSLCAKFVNLVERHPLIKVLDSAEEEDNRDENSGLIVHGWQKWVTCELATIQAELDCDAVRALGAQTKVKVPRLDISHLAWNAITQVGELLRQEIKLEDNRQWQRRVERERENQRLVLPTSYVKKYHRDQSSGCSAFFSKIFCCSGSRKESNYYE